MKSGYWLQRSRLLKQMLTDRRMDGRTEGRTDEQYVKLYDPHTYLKSAQFEDWLSTLFQLFFNNFIIGIFCNILI